MEHETNREVEATLLARSQEGADVLERVAGLTRVGPYSIEVRPTVTIEDRYFDTPEGDLGARGFALRLRRMGDESLVALKGEGTERGGATSRLEIEAPWSRPALGRALAALREAGIIVEDGSPDDQADPESVLEGLGFVVIQERETERRIRHVLAPGTATLLAELDIDTVAYRLPAGNVKVHEIEIEATDETVELAPLVDGILREAPGLVPWKHSKLAMGIAIERGLRSGTLTVGADGAMLPQGFDRIESILEQ